MLMVTDHWYAMPIDSWLALTLADLLGAASPGPSLALVLAKTVAGGRRLGLATGLGHGLGFGLYAMTAAAGLAAALVALPGLTLVLNLAGIALLVWLAVGFFRTAAASPRTTEALSEAADAPSDPGTVRAFAEGFTLAIVNPKILAWMLAIYAAFIRPDTAPITVVSMALLGMLIDAGWYCSVAGVLGGERALGWLRRFSRHLALAMGLLMLAFAVGLTVRTFG